MYYLRKHQKVFFDALIFISIALVSSASFCKKLPEEENYLEPVNVSNNAGRSEDPSIAVDSRGTAHLVWTDYTPGDGKEQIFYAFKPKGGVWTVPVNVSNTSLSARFPSLVVDKEDKLHLAWQQWSGGWVIFYSYKFPQGDWSVPETITGDYMYVVPKLAVDTACNVHLVWKFGGYYAGIRYAMRTNEGFWTPQTTVVERGLNYTPSIAVDNQMKVHLIWPKTADDYLSSDIFYSMKLESGCWSSPENISNTGEASSPTSIIADNQGNIICVWNDGTPPPSKPGVFTRQKRADGTWTTPTPICTLSDVYNSPFLARGPEDELYLPGTGRHKEKDKYYFLYFTKPSGGDWSDTIICGVLRLDPYGVGTGPLVCDDEGRLYFIGEKSEDIYCIEYKTRRKK